MIRTLESAAQLNIVALTNHVDDSPPHSAACAGYNGSDHDDASGKRKTLKPITTKARNLENTKKTQRRLHNPFFFGAFVLSCFRDEGLLYALSSQNSKNRVAYDHLSQRR